MATIKTVIEYIEEWAPLSLQGDFDNCGLKFGEINTEITGILVTLDTNEAVVKEAISKNCNLIIEHHPSIFHAIKKLDYNLPLVKAMSLAISNNITLYSSHTNVDFCDGGLNDYVAEKIGLKNVKYISEHCDPRIGDLPYITTLKDYANFLKELLSDNTIKTIGDPDKKIKKIAVVNGGGGSSEYDLLLAMQAGADVFITGDVKYNVARLSKDADYAIIQFGHYNSELGFMPLVKEKLEKKFTDIKIYQATSLLNPYNE